MTTEQINRIKAAMKPETAIYCATRDEAEMLFDAVGWGCGYSNPFYYWSDSEDAYGWDCTDAKSSVPDGYQVINFSTLIAPQPSPLIIGLRAAGFPDWIDDNVEFMFGTTKWKFSGMHGEFPQLNPYGGEVWRVGSATAVLNMLAHPDQIHPIIKCGAETVEDAKAAMRLGFTDVHRNSDNEVLLSHADDCICISHKRFQELKPRQCVALADILGGE